ncbi:hypothetical protein L226DRAFT_494874 [Lentinus tigrinus ALCF2SS1-7]|uniref:Uncharacterized protein n=1 Tax=Lentinus tigrinus ALCF2SS1-6 TaxID=1328759 RepID=A0A5C2S320_9APHY|nr:hypothetical protein L227DRAFT_529593 [Lentinus tigrinus ALCF2SS1-6]RPD69008.1 hypothetical protein L226DRAFT_494874 [Lentinus tigrinus ALCF2SS1-7]
MFFPLPFTYAVAQISLPASLRGLGELDSQARNVLREIHCSKAIILLHTGSEIPFPRRHDFKYFIYVVGPGLRPEKPERCYTADMCMPIFPNTEHPAGRPSIRTVPEFPFSNCYHWFGPDISFKTRVKNGTYPESDDPLAKCTKLPAGEFVDMETIHQQDVNRIIDMLAERSKSAGVAEADERAKGARGLSQPPGANDDVASFQDENDSYFGPGLDHSDNDSLASGPSDPYAESLNDSSGSRASVKSFTESDIFNMDWTEERSRIPVVTLSFDLAAEFKSEEDIPNPAVFLDECRTFSRMVQEFQEREALRRDRREARRRMLEPFIEMHDKVARGIQSLFCVTSVHHTGCSE